MKSNLSRRTFVRNSFAAAAPALVAANALPLGAAEAMPQVRKPLKIVCVGGHPDDPESGCGGTLLRYAEAGHGVTIVYLTRGERGIRDKGLEESAKIRTGEAEAASRLIGAKAVFAGQIDGATEMTRARVDDMQKILAAAAPDILFTHWPIDTHMDHQVASLLALRANMALRRRAEVFFFEVDLGSQTHGFAPNTYVDISAVVEKKKAALFAHVSQNGEGVWREHHQVMAEFRGRESGVRAAEAFVHLTRITPGSSLPGLA
jgi:LmbE family N-acetylglucosaminyl deacetylase